MADQNSHPTRGTVLKRMTAAMGRHGRPRVYDILADIVIAPERAEAAVSVRRLQEQYLVNNVT